MWGYSERRARLLLRACHGERSSFGARAWDRAANFRHPSTNAPLLRLERIGARAFDQALGPNVVAPVDLECENVSAEPEVLAPEELERAFMAYDGFGDPLPDGPLPFPE